MKKCLSVRFWHHFDKLSAKTRSLIPEKESIEVFLSHSVVAYGISYGASVNFFVKVTIYVNVYLEGIAYSNKIEDRILKYIADKTTKQIAEIKYRRGTLCRSK
ncbi:hypothetical protein AN963_08410 [Brevibacillus choshinensis]|uniref:Uncharacterized protein n=1 Tax=Brevibacillus choshinensis TaxID=54911 RepID=A0ABR5NDV7_BRECH|nr:hypothetical protein AN963_08410 [Brevibacillus choshinensis]